MDYLQPPEQVAEILTIAQIKANLSAKATVLRGILAGAFLGFAILFAWKCADAFHNSMVGAMVFPAGFAVVTLLALELVTGNFAVVTFGWLAGHVSRKELLRNWGWSRLGNLIGSLAAAGAVSFVFTRGVEDMLATSLVVSAEHKTLEYSMLGANGYALVFGKAVLCGVLVGLAALLALTSRSSVGRVVSVWFPIAMFFALGLEHAVVNMFVIPAGMMLGTKVSMFDWLFWNQIPVLLGNLVGAWLVTTLLQKSS